MTTFSGLDKSRSDQGQRLLWVINSDFGKGVPLVVTLVLNDQSKEKEKNNFYLKHVADIHESAKDLWNYRIVADDYEIGRIIGIPQYEVEKHTVIRLGRINHITLAYRIAEACLSINTEHSPEVICVTFPTDCVETITKQGAISNHDTILVKAELTARDGTNLQFEVSHCRGTSAKRTRA